MMFLLTVQTTGRPRHRILVKALSSFVALSEYMDTCGPDADPRMYIAVRLATQDDILEYGD